MRRSVVVLIVLALLGGVAPATAQSPENFRAHLSGDEEVPEVDTDAQGEGVFQLSRDGEELSFRVNAANLEGAIMAHLHVGERGENGPVGVWIRPEEPPPHDPIDVDGVYATGSVTEDDFVGPLEGESMEDLIREIEEGRIYLNVHTQEHRGGEIRGQLF